MTEPAPPLTDDDERNMPIFAQLPMTRCAGWCPACRSSRAPSAICWPSAMLDTAFDVQEALVRRAKPSRRTRGKALRRSDVLLETLRTQWRLAYELRYISVWPVPSTARPRPRSGACWAAGAKPPIEGSRPQVRGVS